MGQVFSSFRNTGRIMPFFRSGMFASWETRFVASEAATKRPFHLTASSWLTLHTGAKSGSFEVTGRMPTNWHRWKGEPSVLFGRQTVPLSALREGRNTMPRIHSGKGWLRDLRV